MRFGCAQPRSRGSTCTRFACTRPLQIDRVLAVRYSDEWAKENLEETGDSDTDGSCTRPRCASLSRAPSCGRLPKSQYHTPTQPLFLVSFRVGCLLPHLPLGGSVCVGGGAAPSRACTLLHNLDTSFYLAVLPPSATQMTRWRCLTRSVVWSGTSCVAGRCSPWMNADRSCVPHPPLTCTHRSFARYVELLAL